MPKATACDVLIVGAGISGIATAYYLSRDSVDRKVTLLDALSPMSFTSAQSGENYRNWWPNPTMTRFVDHSIDLLEGIASDADHPIQLTQSGYALATRSANIDALLAGLRTGFDVLDKPQEIRQAFPAFDPEVRNVITIRRAGHLDSHQLSQYMLKAIRSRGGRVVQGEVRAIDRPGRFRVVLADNRDLDAEQLVVAAGPFVNSVLAHLGERLPVTNILQQKLAIEDARQAIPLNQPFAIDLDGQELDWTSEEREMLLDDERYAHLAGPMPGNVHRRPEGNAHCRWIRLGWAYNKEPAEPHWSPALDDHFPEIVLRAAARLNPALKDYCSDLPAARSHYGGYYTMTDENLPIVGPLATEGAFTVAAMSGFGTMAACAAGELCARWLTGAELPGYANRLSLSRYDDADFMKELRTSNERGVL